MNNLSLKSGSSNFDHEIERVNKYFERNEKCIENYMENQKILVDMNTLRKLDEKA